MMPEKQEFDSIIIFIRKLFNKPEEVIPLHEPVFSGREKELLVNCIETTYVSSVGEYVDLFEKNVAVYTGSKYAVSCVNATAAIHISLLLAGVKPGEEVITQPITFIATVNAITYCGAVPVFVDVNSEMPGMSAEKLESWLKSNIRIDKSTGQAVNKSTGRRVTACLPVHVFGHPCDMDAIMLVCDHYNIPVVEDAAESLGSLYHNEHTGTFGKMGVLSFNGNKIITTGGGGMIITNDKELAERAKHLTTQAKVPHAWEMAHDAIGYNYRLPNINAALGVAQLEKLEEFITIKRRIAKEYEQFFSKLEEVDFIAEPTQTRSNYWLNTLIFKDPKMRNGFLEYTNRKGVLTRPVWHLISGLPMYRYCQHGDLSNANWLGQRMVNLPSSAIS
jgi:aminotransferase in exopolysaccharide biosynthesis